jgi:hypothetical protein
VANHFDIPSGNPKENKLYALSFLKMPLDFLYSKQPIEIMLGLMQYLSRLRNLWFKKKLLYMKLGGV